MPVQATYSIDWDNLLSSTMNNTEGVLFDNIFKDEVLLEKLLAADKVETENGGAKIQKTIEYADGSNYQRVNGYSAIDLTPQEFITTAVDDWKEAVTTVSISRKEERQNSGEHALVNLLTAKMNNASKGFRQGVSGDLLAPGGSSQTASTNAVNPLVQIVPIVRGAGAVENTTLHGINPATATWWKPSTTGRVKSASSNAAPIGDDAYKNEIRSTVNGVKADSGEFPNFALGGRLAWEKYVASLEVQLRYTQGQKADLLQEVACEGMPFAWDRRMIGTSNNAQDTLNFDSGTYDEEVIYFLNLDYLYLIFDSESKFKSMGFVQSQNQLARSAIVVCMYQFMTTNRRSHGALYGIDPDTITVS